MTSLRKRNLSIDSDVHADLVRACEDGDLNTLMSISYNNQSVFQKLVKGDLNYPFKSKFGSYKPGEYLFIACERGHVNVSRQLIKFGSENRLYGKLTPLLVACKNGHLEILKMFAEEGFSLHEEHLLFKDTPIFYCCRYGYKNMVEYILDQIPDILNKSADESIGECPGTRYVEIWSELIRVIKRESGVVLGRLLLYMSCVLEYRDIVELLVTRGVDVNGCLAKVSFNASLEYPLSVACKVMNLDIIYFLLENKAEITESISTQFPELIGKWLERYVKPYQRSYSIANAAKAQNPSPSHDNLVLYWDNLGIYNISRHWLSSYGEKISRIDFHDNRLTKLPFDFFELLPCLDDMDVSCNRLEKLPEQGVQDSKVTQIIACLNSLVTVPLGYFLNQNIVILDLSRNKIRNLPSMQDKQSGTVCPNETFWTCRSMKILKLSKNAIVEIPKEIQGATMLEKLHLEENNLSAFETVWNCPLTDLDLSRNQLQQFSGMTQTVWSKTMIRLNLSLNNLKSISASIIHLANLQYLNLSHNNIKTLPPPSYWKCKRLIKLNLSHNELTGKSIYDGYDIDKNMPFVNTCEFPVELFEDSLEGLDLSSNNLEIFPESICKLKMLCELDLSRNPNLRTIPSTLGNLKNIWNLRLAELNIPELSHFTFEDKNMARQLLPHLRAKLRKSVPFNRMKLMIVGLQGRGKTTLLAAIQGKPQLPDNISTVGITIEQFGLPTKSKLGFFSGNSKPKVIQFSAWDLAGQQVYYATHQCFLTSQTLYLVVFDVRHGYEGIRSLSPWLANIQARAPDSRCIIVGTHLDGLPPNDSRRVTLQSFESLIISSYGKKGFPVISDCLFVSSTNGEGIDLLRHVIHYVAEKMIENGGLPNAGGAGSSVKMAPGSYVALYDNILAENARRKDMKTPPILTTDEMLALAERDVNNDIYCAEELILASKFLHENGVLLHFDDHLRELNNLFFIDPSWLCDMLALVVTIRERNPFINDGYIRRKELMMVLRDPRLPDHFVPQYLRLLERFEITLCLDEEVFLIPSMLPTDRPNLYSRLQPYVDMESEGETKYQCLRRSYHLSYTPSGFWSRLIARLMIAVQKWGMQVSEDDTSSMKEKYKPTLWREGLLVSYDDGFFLVESFYDDITYEEWSNQGVAITVWSNDQDFSVMGFIVDHLDMLITEWYPGLEDVDNTGRNLIQKLIACPICCTNRQDGLKSELSDFKLGDQYSDGFSHHFRNTDHVQQFNLLTCALAATNFQAIHCDKHPDQPVGLQLVVPDLMLTDLPEHFLINPVNFVFTPSLATRLGEGGAGGVYRGEYNTEQVAVKQFHSTTKAKQFERTTSETTLHDSSSSNIFKPSQQSIQELLEDGKVIRAFWELRQEVSMLCRLDHPNIIQFLGVCHSPLCFVIELAPMGSLQGILEKKQKERDLKTNDSSDDATTVLNAILGRYISCRIAFQVIDALYYLHDSEIIYRDLKSDNVLVWSLDDKEKINVKLSDYGIAAFATPQGVVGEGGTPGFQAPEIKYNSPYDEKVDIYSYGIWLYELLSGYRPFREFRTASEMKKAGLRGIRPNLRKDFINTNLPFLEYFMEDCWQQSPVLRPSSEELALAFSQPDLLMLKNVYPRADAMTLQRVRVANPWSQGDGNNILLWSEHDTDRKFQVINIQKEKIAIEKHLPGARVLCACHVEDNVWLGNESTQIEVFGSFGDNKKPSILWKFDLPDSVLAMLTYLKENTLSVLASLVDGRLCVFKKDLEASVKDRPIFNETYEDLISFEKDKWVHTYTLDLGTKHFPAQCMSLTRHQTELWVGSGSFIAIVDPVTITIKGHIEATSKSNRLIYLMVTDANNLVWTSERSMSYVTQWDVEKRTKLFEFQCNIENALDRLIVCDSVRHDSVVSLPSYDEVDNDLEPQPRSRGVSITARTKGSSVSTTSPKIRSRSQESLELSLLDEGKEMLVKPDGFVLRSLQKKPSLMCPPRPGKRSTRKDKNYIPSEIIESSTTRPRAGAVTGKPIRVNCLLYVKGTLWVGRTCGDILVLSVQNDQVPIGKVIAVLGGSNTRHLGGSNRTMSSLVKFPEDEVLAIVRLDVRMSKKSPQKNRKFSQSGPGSGVSFEYYQLLKYKTLNVKEIEDFKEKQSLEH